MRRVRVRGLAGWRALLLADAELDDVVFRNCKLELASFNSAHGCATSPSRAACSTRRSWGAATMRAVRFDGCRMLRADFTGATLARVDLRGSELDPAGDVSGLRGAIIDGVQLAGLAASSRPCGRHHRRRRLMPTETLDHRRVLVVISGLMLVMLLASLDQTIVSTALPTIVEDLGGLEHLSWVVTAYLLAVTAVTPLYGKLGDLFGRKIVLQGALVLFLAGSALCGLAQGMTELIAFRVHPGPRRRRADGQRAGGDRGRRAAGGPRALHGAVRRRLRRLERSPGRCSAGS